MCVQSLASFSGLRIWHCCELWCRLQMQLRSHIVAVVEASCYCSDSTPSLRTSICQKCGPKKKKKIPSPIPTPKLLLARQNEKSDYAGTSLFKYSSPCDKSYTLQDTKTRLSWIKFCVSPNSYVEMLIFQCDAIGR